MNDDASNQPPTPAHEARAAATPAPSFPDPRLRVLIEALGAEEGARVFVEELRWPEGVICPRCGSGRTGTIEARRKYYCNDCSYQFRVTAGTVFHNSHVSLARWLVAIQLILESERGFPANRLQSVIGGSYKTAWYVGHRIRAAMSRSFVELGMPVALARAVTEAERAATPAELLQSGGPASDRWILVKKLIAGTYHRPSSDYLSAYWNEARWRAAHISNQNAFRETVRALIDTEPLPYDQLVDRTRPQAVIRSSPRGSLRS